MLNLKVGIGLQALDRPTASLKGLSKSAGSTRTALAKLGDQAGAAGKRASRSELIGGHADRSSPLATIGTRTIEPTVEAMPI